MENILIKEENAGSFFGKKFEIKNINKVPYFCVPMREDLDGANPVPKFDITKEYSAECESLTLINEDIIKKIEIAANETQELRKKISEMEKHATPVRMKKYVISKKRDRRKSGDIDKNFVCELCTKKSEGSLNHHIKIKHIELFQQLQILKVQEDAKKKIQQNKDCE